VQSNRPIVAESIPAPVPTAPPPAAKRQTMIGMPNALATRQNGGASAPAPRPAQPSAPKAFQRTLLGGLGAGGQSGTPARAPAPPPPNYPPPPWTVAVTEEDQRELTTDQVVALYAVGTIDEGTYVWRDGMDDWCSPFEAPDLRRALQAARISPREPLDSDEGDDDEAEAFDQSDDPIVPSSPLADEADDRRHPGMWHEPGRLGGGYDAGFEDVTVSMNEKETEGLLRKARRAEFEDEPTVARGATGLRSPFVEAAARAPSPLRGVRPEAFEFDDEEVTQAISTSEARAPFDRHDNASQRAFELSQRKHGAQTSQDAALLRGSTRPPPAVAAHAGASQESSTVFSLQALTQQGGSSRPPAARTEMFPSNSPSSPPIFRQPPRPPVRKPPQSLPSSPMAQLSSFPPAAQRSAAQPSAAQPSAAQPSSHLSSRPPALAQQAAERVHYPSSPPNSDSARVAQAVERGFPSSPPARLSVAASRPPAPVLDEDSDVFAYPHRKRAKWPFVAALLVVAGAAGASYQLRQPLPLWAKVHELSGQQFPAWPELRPASAPEPPKAPAATTAEARPVPPPAAAPSTTADTSTAPAEPDTAPAAAVKDKDRDRERPREASDAAPVEAKAEPSAEPAAAASAESPAEDEASKTEDLPEFDRGAAAEALGQAAASAATCKAADGPTGRGRATVTFANSGRATNANVTGTFAGTTVGGCVAELFRQARVPAFSGPPVKVAKSFTVE